MKYNIIYLLAILSVIFVSCEDEKEYTPFYGEATGNPPTLTISVDGNDLNEENQAYVDLSGAIQFSDTVIEVGIMYSMNEDFSTLTSVVVEPTLDGTYSTTIAGLESLTKYYVKSYAVDASGFNYSEVSTFTTMEVPQFEDTYLFGTFDQVDIDLISGETLEAYEVTIEQKGGLYNKILITNFWDAGRTVEATVNFETKRITFSEDPIYVHATYGDCLARAIDNTGANIGPATGTYDENGKITMDYWGAFVDAGYFGLYSSTLTKK